MRLFKVYIPYSEEHVVLHLCFAETEHDAVKMTGFVSDDHPRPAAREIPIKEGPCMCHHIADHNLYGRLKWSE